MKIYDEIKNVKTDLATLRSFGWMVGGIFVLIGLIPGFSHGAWVNGWGLLGAVLCCLGLLIPRMLKYVFIVWMTFGIVMNRVVSPVLFTLLYLLSFAPIGIISRCCGKKFIDLDFKNNADTYWVDKKEKVNPQASAENQF